MPSLKDIRTRIHSVKNIQKITRTMEMVAAAQLRKAQTKAEQARPYSAMLDKLLDSFTKDDLTHPLLVERPVKKVLLVIIGADRGLCGSYHTNIYSKVNRFLKDYQDKQIQLIPIGRKIIEHYRSPEWNIRHRVSLWDKMSYHDVVLLSELLIDSFIAEECDAVWIVYTEYINVLSRKIMVEKLLPLECSFVNKNGKRPDRILEPSAEELFAALLPRYCITKIQKALNEAHASELAARILSMKTATNNADDMIKKLTLDCNKVRQASITREIAEISNGTNL